MTTQAVILARGLGSRMRRQSESSLTEEQAAVASTGSKGMIPFGRPFLDYVISALADAGITHVVLVVAPDATQMREYFTVTAPPQRVRISFAVQDEPRGTADAVLAAKSSVGDAPFLVLNADNYYPVDAVRRLAEINGSGIVAFEAEALVRESRIEPERVMSYALLDINERDELVDLVEKPAADHPLAVRATRWVSMNLWSFTSSIFDACARIQPSSRGELEIQDAVRMAIRSGERIHVVRTHAGILDLSSRSDIAAVASRLAEIEARP